jgi:hypothetical protein
MCGDASISVDEISDSLEPPSLASGWLKRLIAYTQGLGLFSWVQVYGCSIGVEVSGNLIYTCTKMN